MVIKHGTVLNSDNLEMYALSIDNALTSIGPLMVYTLQNVEVHLQAVDMSLGSITPFVIYKDGVYHWIKEVVLKDDIEYIPRIMKKCEGIFLCAEGGVPREIETYLMDKPIDELILPIYTMNALKNNRINTLGKLVNKTEKELRRMRHIGLQSIDNIKKALKEEGLQLKENK